MVHLLELVRRVRTPRGRGSARCGAADKWEGKRAGVVHLLEIVRRVRTPEEAAPRSTPRRSSRCTARAAGSTARSAPSSLLDDAGAPLATPCVPGRTRWRFLSQKALLQGWKIIVPLTTGMRLLFGVSMMICWSALLCVLPASVHALDGTVAAEAHKDRTPLCCGRSGPA